MYTFITITFLIFTTQVNSQEFKIVFKTACRATYSNGIATSVDGDLAIENQKGEIIAEGKAEIEEGCIALRGKKGASFEYDSQTSKMDLRKWSDKEPGKFAKISMTKNQWTIGNDNFFFLMHDQVMGRTTEILLPESITRASILTLPKGNHELFGYKIKAMKDGARVKFLRGIIVECNDCNILESR